MNLISVLKNLAETCKTRKKPQLMLSLNAMAWQEQVLLLIYKQCQSRQLHKRAALKDVRSNQKDRIREYLFRIQTYDKTDFLCIPSLMDFITCELSTAQEESIPSMICLA